MSPRYDASSRASASGLAASSSFVDLSFRIREYQRTADGGQRIRADSSYHGQQIELLLELGNEWRPRNLGADAPFVVQEGVAVIVRDGVESDALLRTLDELYRTVLRPRALKPRSEFIAIAKLGAPERLAEGSVQLELSTPLASDAERAEFALTIDLANERLELSEKSPSFRRALIQQLACADGDCPSN
jgi:hypothetical protein